MSSLSNKKIEKLRNKAYRDAYVRARIDIGIPHQIRALREQRGWSQSELGRRSGKPANVINRLENPESGGNTIRTCLEMAAAFDVALLVKFVSYSRFLKEFEDVSPSALEVPSFCDDHFLSVDLQYRQTIVEFKYFQPQDGLIVSAAQNSGFVTGIYHPTPLKSEGELYAKESEARNIPLNFFIGNPAITHSQRAPVT